MRVHQQPAFVLLNRPFSETSWIVEIFSRDHGRLALIAKGARRLKSRLKGVLLPFQPLLLSWSGKGELPTLTSAEIDLSEINLADYSLHGDAMVCAFYCNELLVKLLHRYDPHPKLYRQYQKTILMLGSGHTGDDIATANSALAACLREFEKVAIKESGYGISFEREADGKTLLKDSSYYRFQSGQGFVASTADHPKAVTGRVIRSLLESGRNLEAPVSAEQMTQGKHLMREILDQTTGHRKVVSRDLFYPK